MYIPLLITNKKKLYLIMLYTQSIILQHNNRLYNVLNYITLYNVIKLIILYNNK